jgi:protein-S-isoprenylcysteine O-methyltransferase Ste14
MNTHVHPGTANPHNRRRKLVHKKFATHLASFVFLFFLVFSTSRWGAHSVLFEVLYPLGILLVGLATVARLWTSIYHAGFKVHTLLTVGPYSMCRNPMYFCNCVGAVGAGMATGMISMTMLILASLILYYPFVIRREERKLRKKHGMEFEAYRRRTPAFLPNWRLLVEPEEYTTNIRFFRTKIIDSSVPFIALAAIHVIQSLHSYDLLPHLFQLY